MKFLFKRKFPMLTLALLFISLVLGASSAYAFSLGDCGDSHEVCKSVTMYVGDAAGYTDTIYATAGTRIFYSFNTDSTSLFNVSFYVVNTYGTFMSDVKNAAQYGGTDGSSFYAPSDGYYKLRTKCGDTTSFRCSGYGAIYYYR